MIVVTRSITSFHQPSLQRNKLDLWINFIFSVKLKLRYWRLDICTLSFSFMEKFIHGFCLLYSLVCVIRCSYVSLFLFLILFSRWLLECSLSLSADFASLKSYRLFLVAVFCVYSSSSVSSPLLYSHIYIHIVVNLFSRALDVQNK